MPLIMIIALFAGISTWVGFGGWLGLTLAPVIGGVIYIGMIALLDYIYS
jgi:hypothetical protein